MATQKKKEQGNTNSVWNKSYEMKHADAGEILDPNRLLHNISGTIGEIIVSSLASNLFRKVTPT